MFDNCEWYFDSRSFISAWEAEDTSCKECLIRSGLLTRSVRKQIGDFADQIMAAQDFCGSHRIVLGLEYEFHTEYVPSPWIAPRRHKSETQRGFRSRLITWIYGCICNRIVGIGEYYEIPDDDFAVGVEFGIREYYEFHSDIRKIIGRAKSLEVKT